ncbi:Spermatogenesis- And Oogenesis-Specific Basic Helix-Loop-Helix-Containing Protein 2 [Manis pentadactyla]|nr:Spermatogenesis- And Oogenesis-Specific Basic Helix-Loop-Helix-Containing Protein 2 [Manis pentadactyla]
MAAPVSGGGLGAAGGQAKIDLLLVGDVSVQYLADSIQKFFSNVAEVTVTVSDVKKAAAFLDKGTFNIVFLKMASLPAAEGLEAVKLTRFGKKKNTDLLFVFIIPENFKGFISGHRAEITLMEPVTVEKMNIVLKYWKTCFSNTVQNENSVKPEDCGLPQYKPCSEHRGHYSTDLFACPESLGNDIGVELKAPLSDFEKSQRISLLHSSKEKLRRERIKHCCEQLRALLPYAKGRKNDAASILEATVDYVKYIREKIPPAVMSQITEALQSNGRFCKRQMPVHLPFPGTVMAQRENSVLTSTYSPARGISFLANKCFNVYSVPAPGGSMEEAVRGQCSSTSETTIGDMHKPQIPSPALSLSTFHAVRYYSRVSPAYDTTVANQSSSVHFPSATPGVPTSRPQHCNAVPGQMGTEQPNCPTRPPAEAEGPLPEEASRTLPFSSADDNLHGK